jgi:hypothetical protein
MELKYQPNARETWPAPHRAGFKCEPTQVTRVHSRCTFLAIHELIAPKSLVVEPPSQFGAQAGSKVRRQSRVKKLPYVALAGFITSFERSA